MQRGRFYAGPEKKRESINDSCGFLHFTSSFNCFAGAAPVTVRNLNGKEIVDAYPLVADGA